MAESSPQENAQTPRATESSVGLSVDLMHGDDESNEPTIPTSPLSPRTLIDGAKRLSFRLSHSPRQKFREAVWRCIAASRSSAERASSVRHSFESSLTRVQNTKQRFRERASVAQVRLRENAELANARLRETHAISVAQYYLLTAATLLLVMLVIYWTIVSSLKLLARVEVVWWLTRSAKLDDFRLWAQEQCAESWNGETVLCQAVDGSWLARELIRVKLSEVPAADSTRGALTIT